jgi:hypothetical protein
MITCDGAGASHDLVSHLEELAQRPGRTLIWSVGWELGEREKAAIAQVPPEAWPLAVDAAGEVRERRADGACANRDCGHRKCWVQEAQVAELTGIMRGGYEDSLANARPGCGTVKASGSACSGHPAARRRPGRPVSLDQVHRNPNAQ